MKMTGARFGATLLADERGGVLAFIAVTMVAILAIMALAIDLSMLLTTRAEAQRVSDSSSLAGASAYIDFEIDEPETSDTAIARAKQFAGGNNVGKKLVDVTTGNKFAFTHPADGDGWAVVGPEITIQALPNAQPDPKVRVWISRGGLGAWFARLLGITALDVRAMAAAVAAEGTHVNEDQCIMPIMISDWWHDMDDDLDGDRLPDIGEEWEWDDGDIYDPFSVPGYDPNPQPGFGNDYHGTGYGSPHRNPPLDDDYVNDLGRRVWMKDGPKGQAGGGSGGESPGGLDEMWAPGNYGWWAMPDPSLDCAINDGAEWLRSNILTCNGCPISVSPEDPYEALTEPGNIASVKEEFEQLYATDPTLEWKENCTCQTQSDCLNSCIISGYANPLDSPRIRPVAVFSPDQQASIKGRNPVDFNNFAWFMFEGGGSKDLFWPDFQVYGRYLGPVSGTGDEGEGGSLVRYLRLVE